MEGIGPQTETSTAPLFRRYAFKTQDFLIRHATPVAAVAITLLIILMAFFLYQQETAAANSKKLLLHTYDVKVHIRTLMSRTFSAQLAHGSYIITGDEKFLTHYQNAVENFQRHNPPMEPRERDNNSVAQEIGILRTLTADNPLQQKNLDETEGLMDELLSYMASAVEMRKTYGREKVLQSFDVNKRQLLTESIRTTLLSMLTEEDRLLQARAKSERENAWKTRVMMMAGMALFYAVVILAIWLCQKAEKLSRAQVAQHASYLKQIMNTIIDGLIVIDDRGTVQSMNTAAEKLFNYAPEEVIGRNVKMLMPEPYHGEHDGYIKNYRETGKTKVIGIGREVTGRRKDGSTFPMELGVSETRLNNRRLFAGTIRDITARKQLEHEKEKFIGALKQSNQELDDFAYIASHDLKEPLRGITNNALFLKEDLSEHLDDKTKKRIERMAYLCQRMERLVDDLLYFSRLGRQELAVQTTNLNEVISDITSMMETTLHDTNTQVVIPQPLPTITCDLPRITEVFRNLITNAVKYNKSEDKRIEIGCTEAANANDPKMKSGMAFYVRDNGIGIPEQFHRDIFRIFKRLNEEDDTVKGTGVGLTFVQKIVERHGGRIWLDSKVGNGTTFYFTLNTGKEAS